MIGKIRYYPQSSRMQVLTEARSRHGFNNRDVTIGPGTSLVINIIHRDEALFALEKLIDIDQELLDNKP